MICAQVHTQCHKSYVRVICISKGMQKSLGCALYVRCALSVGKYGKQTKNSQNRVHNHETEYHKWENNFVFTCIINNFISITVTIYIKTNILNTYLKFPCIIINIVSINMETNKCIILLQLWLKVKLFFAVAMTNMLNMNISTFSSAPTTFTKNGPY